MGNLTPHPHGIRRQGGVSASGTRSPLLLDILHSGEPTIWLGRIAIR